MLVISRKLNESIIIEPENGGEPVEIKLISVDNQVKLGISAPRGCKIWRKELYSTVQLNRKAAQSASPKMLKGLTLRISGDSGKSE